MKNLKQFGMYEYYVKKRYFVQTNREHVFDPHRRQFVRRRDSSSWTCQSKLCPTCDVGRQYAPCGGLLKGYG